MKYQLVLQFAANTEDDFDRFVSLEDKLIDELGSVATVDGHDFGQSEFNIFILTDEPTVSFEKVQHIVRSQGLQQGMRAAYRELTHENYVILWPSGLAEFTVS